MSAEVNSQEKEIVVYIGTRRLVALEGIVGHGEPRVIRSVRQAKPDGFENGLVTNLEKAAASIEKLLETLAENSEDEISCSVVLGHSKIQSYTFSSSQYYQGAARPVSSQEIRSVIAQTRSVATLPLTEIILQVVPESFVVDDMEDIRNPLGLEARRLGVNLKIYTMNFQDFKNLASAFETAEVRVKGFYPKALPLSEGVLTESEKTDGAVIVDIADEDARLVLWKNGNMLDSKNVPLGGKFMTEQIAQGWNIDGTDAEKVKEQYASLISHPDFGEELIPLIERQGKGHHPIRRQEFQEKFFAQSKGWMKNLLAEVDAFVEEGKLRFPHYVFTGGGTRPDGFLEFLQAQFSREARIGLVRRLDAPNELLVDLSMTAALGMFRWMGNYERDQKRLTAPTGLLQKTMGSARDWFFAYF